MGRLVLVRHGQSSWNAQGRVQGQSDPGLTELGHRQAEAAAAWLANAYPDATLVTSDLVRCVETGGPLERTLARIPERDASVRERDYGQWEGLLDHEAQERFPDLWRRYHAQEDVVGEVGGESTLILTERVSVAFRRIAAAGVATVVVSHGGPIWFGTHELLGVPRGTLGPVANASITIIDVHDDGRARLLSWNQVAHLAPTDVTTWRERPSADAAA